MAQHEAVRAETIRLGSALLLGPMMSDELIPSAPADTYLTGILWPEGVVLGAIEDDQDDGAASSDDGETDAGVPGYRAIRPCSLGLTFAADADATLTIGLAETARYLATEGEPATSGGRRIRMWQRHALGYQAEITPGPAGTWKIHEYRTADGTLASDPTVELHIRRRIDGVRQVLTVTLINRSEETDDRLRDELCLFQTGLIVEIAGKESQGAIHPRAVLPPAGGDEDAQSAALLYRHAVEFAVGHGVAAEWDAPTNQRVHRVMSTWLPQIAVRGMSADGHPSLSSFSERHPEALRAAWLARAEARNEVTEALDAFALTYRNWIDTELEARLAMFSGDLRIAAERNLRRCRDASGRIDRGIAILRQSDIAWRSFVLANEAMDRQARYESKRERAAPLVWRPFQLAYILLVLPGLVNLDDDDRDCVDLLWFPTGGGKTEAYLGLTAFQIFIRRLTNGSRRGSGGVDVLMRYTLRLLTVQQFQRAAALICACDSLREENDQLGSAPISLGLYVGGDATPNRTAVARSALAEEHAGQAPRSTPRQLLECPVCGHALPPSSYSMPADRDTIDIVCGNVACETAGRPLPVLTVDDLIYAAPTSLLIGTIDKFAQLPRRRDLRALFGLDGGMPPGLIIQDELHLISGPLGSMAGLYESVIDQLCSDGVIRPKVIGSTATIGQAARQVRALFDRTVLQFPPSGFDADDSFFAVRDDIGADRIYLGISSAGRSPKFALQAAAATFLQTAAELQFGGAAPSDLDPFWTCVLYFNSLRELGGAHALLQDDVPRQMRFLASRLSGPVRRLEAEPVELSSRVPSRDLPDKLNRLSTDLFTAAADPFAPQPEDAVLASNMISVGVDVPRLGLMIVNGQPKSTAEYIQASSRVGRGIHGLVITLYNFGRPRDVSHFEHFNGYHAALYRSVEASSVTPWAPRARDKALHAVVAAVVRHLVSGMDGDRAARDFVATDANVQHLIAAIAARAGSASGDIETADTLADLHGIVAEWGQRSQDARSGGKQLLYWEKPAPFGMTLPHLMTSAEEGGRPSRLAWPTPNSMREVEPSTAFGLKLIGRQ